MSARHLRGMVGNAAALITSVIVLVGLGCGCGGGGADVLAPGLSASFAPSSTSPAANLIRLRGDSASGDVLNIEVAIGGPTTSTDLFGFAFDLVIADTTVVRFEGATPGDALTTAGGQNRTVQAAMAGNHLVVGVSKLGGGSGNGVPGGEAVLVTLTMKVLKVGSTTVSFAGAAAQSDPSSGPAALDSSGQVVPSVRFDAQPATLTGQ